MKAARCTTFSLVQLRKLEDLQGKLQSQVYCSKIISLRAQSIFEFKTIKSNNYLQEYLILKNQDQVTQPIEPFIRLWQLTITPSKKLMFYFVTSLEPLILLSSSVLRKSLPKLFRLFFGELA